MTAAITILFVLFAAGLVVVWIVLPDAIAFLVTLVLVVVALWWSMTLRDRDRDA